MTSYRTPDPLRALLLDRALEADTMQYFDLLDAGIRPYAPGPVGLRRGRGSGVRGPGLNPFRRPGERSAVFWSGLIDVGPEAATVEVPVPASFSGRLRVMGVACGDGAVRLRPRGPNACWFRPKVGDSAADACNSRPRATNSRPPSS